MIGSLEFSMPYIAKIGFLYNAMMRQSWVARAIDKVLGMVDTPLISDQHTLTKTIDTWSVKLATPEALAKLSQVDQ
jgi:hypothetical protein